MKPKNYSAAFMLCISLLIGIHSSQARSFLPFPTSPQSGITDFNSLYSGSFVALTPGIQSASGEGLVAANVAGYDFRLIASHDVADCGIGIDVITGQTALVYGYTVNSLTHLTALEITANDGKFFDLQSIDISIDGLSSGTTKNVRLIGYIGNTPVSGAMLEQAVTAIVKGGKLVNFNVAANTRFIGINKFRIETDGTYFINGKIAVDNINAINFRGILPVTLVTFNATIQNNTAVLNWSMTSELNSSAFIVERSADGNNFNSIGAMPASKNCIGVAAYTFTDNHPASGINFYRITFVNILKEETPLSVIKINFTPVNTAIIYPNPVSGGSITLQTGEVKEDKHSYVITDISGKPVVTGTISDYRQQINIAGLNGGFYVLRLWNGTSVKFQKQ